MRYTSDLMLVVHFTIEENGEFLPHPRNFSSQVLKKSLCQLISCKMSLVSLLSSVDALDSVVDHFCNVFSLASNNNSFALPHLRYFNVQLMRWTNNHTGNARQDCSTSTSSSLVLVSCMNLMFTRTFREFDALSQGGNGLALPIRILKWILWWGYY